MDESKRQGWVTRAAPWLVFLTTAGCTLRSEPPPVFDGAPSSDRTDRPDAGPPPPSVTGIDDQRPTRLPPLSASSTDGRHGAIQLASHHELVEVVQPNEPAAKVSPLGAGGEPELVPPGNSAKIIPPRADGSALQAAKTFPIDLANALALGGANNFQVQLARERVIEAQARWGQAWASILPSLWMGVGYNKHDGRLQETEGNVLEISRQSLFVGGGAGLAEASVAGGASGPSRLVVNLSLADAAFNPLIGFQRYESAGAEQAAVLNDSLAEIAAAYFSLVEAHALAANAGAGLQAADEMVRLTTLFAKEGKGSVSEQHRATAERAVWQGRVEDDRRRTISRSAALARLLRLDPSVILEPVEDRVTPVEFAPPGAPVEELVARGISARPELAQHRSLFDAAAYQLRQERLRPWLPNVQLGASAGTFGGGPSHTFDNQSDRSDVDVLAVWELRNLGVGNAMLRRRRASELRQAQVEVEQIQNQIIAEIVTAAGDVDSYHRQMETARAGLVAAVKSYEANLARIRAAEGLPIELLQAIRARGDAQNALTEAISNFNRAQFNLLRATGQAPVPAGR